MAGRADVAEVRPRLSAPVVSEERYAEAMKGMVTMMPGSEKILPGALWSAWFSVRIRGWARMPTKLAKSSYHW